jgi:hypothetical protein
MKKILKYIAGLGLLALIVTIAGWLFWHYQGLKPKLIFEMPASSFKVSYNYRRLLRSKEVDVLCQKKGFENGMFFAVKGYKVVRFIPMAFHAVHGEMDFVEADPDMLYFYQYRERYRTLVWTP